MKLRTLIVTIVFAVLILFTDSIYAANGDLIVNGNLGVGTTGPITPKAEINGNMKVDGTMTVQGNLVTNSTTTLGGNTVVNGVVQSTSGGFIFPDGTTLGSIAYVKVSDTKNNGIAAQSFTTSAWNTRDITTKDSDDNNIASIANDSVTLPAGTYMVKIVATAVANGCNPAGAKFKAKSRLRNVTDNITQISGVGMSSYYPYASSGGGINDVSGKFTISGTKTFQIQTWVGMSGGCFSGGDAMSTGDSEVYMTAEFYKIK